MKREELKEIGLDEEAINKVMALHGKDVNGLKEEAEKKAAEFEQLKEELSKANETLDKVKDYDEVKANYEKYKTDLETSKKDYAEKIAAMELNAKVKEFTSSKKFVNELTKDAINTQLVAALNDESNKGKSLDDLLNGLTEGKDNIFAVENVPQAPTVTTLNGDNGEHESGVMAAFRRLNPNIKL